MVKSRDRKSYSAIVSAATLITFIISSQPHYVASLFGNASSITTGLQNDNSIIASRSISFNANITPPNFFTYANSTYGIRIMYPSDWIYVVHAITHAPLPRLQSIVTFETLHSINKSKGVVALLSVAVENFTVVPSLGEYTLGYRTHIAQSSAYHIVQSKPVTVAGRYPGYEVFSFIIGGNPTYKTLGGQVWTIENDKLYLISFVTEYPSDMGNSYYMPIIQKMIDSFQILNSTTIRS
jgi:hypothetical protein